MELLLSASQQKAKDSQKFRLTRVIGNVLRERLFNMDLLPNVLEAWAHPLNAFLIVPLMNEFGGY